MSMTKEEYTERREKVLNRVPTPPRYTTEEYERYFALRESRTIRTLEQFPGEIKDSVAVAIYYLTSNNPHITQISLRGSFMKGEWVTSETDPEFVRLRSVIRHKTKLSDIDLVIEDMQDMFEIDGLKFDIIPSDRNSVKIWEKII